VPGAGECRCSSGHGSEVCARDGVRCRVRIVVGVKSGDDTRLHGGSAAAKARDSRSARVNRARGVCRRRTSRTLRTRRERNERATPGQDRRWHQGWSNPDSGGCTHTVSRPARRRSTTRSNRTSDWRRNERGRVKHGGVRRRPVALGAESRRIGTGLWQPRRASARGCNLK